MTYHIEVSLVPFSAIERSSSASGMQRKSWCETCWQMEECANKNQV